MTYEHLATTCFDYFKLGIQPSPGKCLHLQNQLDQNITCCLPSINPNQTTNVNTHKKKLDLAFTCFIEIVLKVCPNDNDIGMDGECFNLVGSGSSAATSEL